MANVPPDIEHFKDFGGGITEFPNKDNVKLTSWSIPLEILDKAALVQYCQMLKEFVVRLQAENNLCKYFTSMWFKSMHYIMGLFGIV